MAEAGGFTDRCDNQFRALPHILAAGLEPALSRLSVWFLCHWNTLVQCHRWDLNPQEHDPKPCLSTNCSTVTYTAGRGRTCALPILNRLSLPLEYSGIMP